MYGALREGDVIRFAWSGYDGSAIQWTQGKTGNEVWLPAHRELREILEESRRRAARSPRDRADLPDLSGAPASAGQEIKSKRSRFDQSLGGTPEMSPRPGPIASLTLVTNQRGVPYTGNGFRVMFFRLVRKLEAEGKVGPGLTFHGLRHTAGKMLDEAGCDTRTIAAVLGQRSEAMARHYSDEGDRRRRVVVAIRRLERRKPK